MKTLQTITKLLTIEKLVHTIMVVFALASVGNVSSYLQAHGHTLLTSYALGVALGGVLVASAMLLADVDIEHEPKRFGFMVIIVLAVGLLSGTIQTQAYASHEGMDLRNARLMGYGLPLLCEGALAVFVSVYGATRRRKNIRMATEGTAEQVAGAVAQALADVDVTRVRKYVEKRIDGLTRAIVDQTIYELMPVVTPAPAVAVLEAPHDAVATATNIDTDTMQNGAQGVTNVAPTAPNLSQNVDESPVFETVLDAGRARANENKRNAATQRRLKVLTVLDSTLSKDELNFAQVGRELGNVSGQTISNDLKWLERQGYWLNGSDWKMTDQGRDWMGGTV